MVYRRRKSRVADLFMSFPAPEDLRIGPAQIDEILQKLTVPVVSIRVPAGSDHRKDP